MDNNSGLGTKLKFDLAPGQSNVIKVIGVGGGGSNAINYMYNQDIKGVDFIICNTDAQALENSPVPTKIQLGLNLTEGLGAGANPEIGSLAAQESIEEIDRVLDKNTKMVFITAGMGGGTGTGAAPVIAELAKNKDILTVGIVTIPFQFEGKIRQEQALIGVERLRKHVDSLIVINNNKLREVYGNLGFKAGYAKSDEVLSTASRGIAEVISQHYLMNIDLRDAKTVLSNSGTAIMGSAVASGENRAKDAVTSALDSPLLNENKITGAKNVLLLIVCGSEAEDEITIDEIGEINDYIQNESGHNANIIMGVGNDDKLGNSVSVTVIATGFDLEQQSELINKDNVIKHMLGTEQSATQVLNLTPGVKSTTSTFSSNQSITPKSDFEKNEIISKPVENSSVQPQRIVHVLDEEVEKPEKKFNVDSIAKSKPLVSTPLVNDLDKFFEIVEPVKITTKILDSKVEEPVKQVIEIGKHNIFDESNKVEPIKEVDTENTFNFKIDSQPTSNSTTLFFLDETIPVAPKQVATSKEQPMIHNDTVQVVKHILDIDTYIEHEASLTNAKPMAKVETKHTLVEDPDLDMIVRIEEPNTSKSSYIRDSRVNEDLLKTKEHQEILRANSEARKQKMKEFNHTFSNSRSTSDLDKPAYERLGINIDLNSNETTGSSRVSVDTVNNELKIRSNNSFLHDNVD